jgi:hypothetical protein
MPNNVSDPAARVTTTNSTGTITNSRIGDTSMPPGWGSPCLARQVFLLAADICTVAPKL